MRAINSPVVLLGRLPIFIRVEPKFSILRIITAGPRRRQMGPSPKSAARAVVSIFEISVWGCLGTIAQTSRRHCTCYQPSIALRSSRAEVIPRPVGEIASDHRSVGGRQTASLYRGARSRGSFPARPFFKGREVECDRKLESCTFHRWRGAAVEADHIAQFVVLPAETSSIYARRDEPVGFVTGLGIAVASICGAKISSLTPVQAKTEPRGDASSGELLASS